MDATEIRRLFASVPAERQILTVNGLIYDYVHYRHNQAGTAELIDNNHRFLPFAKRLEEDGKVEVQIRCWEFNIDMIEILDETTGKYHPMWSTDPDYTGGLSRWEHRFYCELLKQSDRGAARQKGRVKAKAKGEQLKSYDEKIPELSIRDRQKPFALIEAEEKRSLEIESAQDRAGHVAADVTDEPVSWKATPGGADRQDLPKPPPQSRGKGSQGKKRPPKPPKRPSNYGFASTADLTRPAAPSDEHPFADPPAGKPTSKFQRRRPNQ